MLFNIDTFSTYMLIGVYDGCL